MCNKYKYYKTTCRLLAPSLCDHEHALSPHSALHGLTHRQKIRRRWVGGHEPTLWKSRVKHKETPVAAVVEDQQSPIL